MEGGFILKLACASTQMRNSQSTGGSVHYSGMAAMCTALLSAIDKPDCVTEEFPA